MKKHLLVAAVVLGWPASAFSEACKVQDWKMVNAIVERFGDPRRDDM